MNGNFQAQFQLDFRTGRPTAISGDFVTTSERAACAALNRQRTRGIKEATRPAPPGESFQDDGWNALVARKAVEWNVPLISLSVFGLSFDEEGFFVSKELKRLGSGAEATAWGDMEARVVFKLFDLRNYALGKKLTLEHDEDYQLRAIPQDANLDDTLEKLTILHEAGACPTEIVGLADTGDYLIAKQPLCQPFVNEEEDRRVATTNVKAVVPKYSIGREVRVIWAQEQPWCLGDLHRGNIMREADGTPTIIDALIGPLPPVILRSNPSLQVAVNRARALREGRALESDDFSHGISDDDL